MGEEKFKSVAMMIQKPQFAKLVKTHTFVTSCFDMVILTGVITPNNRIFFPKNHFF